MLVFVNETPSIFLECLLVLVSSLRLIRTHVLMLGTHDILNHSIFTNLYKTTLYGNSRNIRVEKLI